MEQVGRFVLASASPRRREILAQLGLRFQVLPSRVEERLLAGESPVDFAGRMAAEKADEVARSLEKENQEAFILGADTVVVVDGDILGKPRGDSEACEMLYRLSGRWHEVITAIALRRVNSGFRDHDVVSTRVLFRPLDAPTIARYIESGEGRDKAGSYAIQGLGVGLVSQIEGSYTNVVGLPATHTLAMLMRAGLVLQWP
ncbi:MAG: septum formation inhibitor Maf [Deltaproteobacteria bacterium]|nr:septum formation inhibitor Maf [Deltaproteobacteria bacterium]